MKYRYKKTNQKHAETPNKLEKYILAAYYNDARLNILTALNDIRVKSGMMPISNEDQIRTALSGLNIEKAIPEQQDELIKQLRHRFPFLDLLTDPNGSLNQQQQDNATPLPHYYESQLTWMLELINGLRNTMAHPVDDEFTIPYAMHKKLYFGLSKIYDSSYHKIKDRFGHESDTMKPFQRCDQQGKPKQPKRFSFALSTAPFELDESSNLPQSEIIHDFGHILFCSLFLEKSQSAELINYYWETKHGNYWKNTDQRSIIREMIAVYRVKLPLQRLKSGDSTTAVTLDTLSELSRCPRVLLNSLSPEDQESFRGEPGENNNQQDSQQSSENTYLFARSNQDRFITLMMRYFDFDPNNEIRFAIDLGQLYYNVRLKPAEQFTDNRSRVRRLGQKILTYGRLDYLEKAEKPLDWQQLEQNYQQSNEEEKQQATIASDQIKQLRPYIVPSYPHYHYFDDKIGFRLSQTSEQYPQLNAQNAEAAIVLDPPKGQDMQPKYWISPTQMLHFVFYSYLQKHHPNFEKPAILLRQYKAGIKKMLNALANGQYTLTAAPNTPERREQAQKWVNEQFSRSINRHCNISLSNLPNLLKKQLLGAEARQITLSEVIARATHILEETKKKQDQIQKLLKSDKKRGKRGFKPIKCGNIGDFLAEDIMRFQPVDGNKPDGGKINSQQYQILQKTLAYYGAHINEPPRIVDLLNDAGLLKGAFAHPFLHKLKLQEQPDQYKGLISFYIAYLKARKEYLNAFIKEQKNRKNINHLPQWLRLRQHASLKNWLYGKNNDGTGQLDAQGNLLQPVPLLNNMFYPAILNLVSQALNIEADELEKAECKKSSKMAKSLT